MLPSMHGAVEQRLRSLGLVDTARLCFLKRNARSSIDL